MFGTIVKLAFLCALCFGIYKVARWSGERVRLQVKGVAFISPFSIVTDTVSVFKAWQASPTLSFAQLLLKVLQDGFQGRPLPPKCSVFFLGTPYVVFTKCDCLEELYLSQNPLVTTSYT